MFKFIVSSIALIGMTTYASEFVVVIKPNNFTTKKEIIPSKPEKETIRCAIGEGETRYSLIQKINNNFDVTNVCTSNITDFSNIVNNAAFNQDISRWDVSNGYIFTAMFFGAISFNQDLSNWDVSNGNDFIGMFQGATSFNQDLSNWTVDNANAWDYFAFETQMPMDYIPQKFWYY